MKVDCPSLSLARKYSSDYGFEEVSNVLTVRIKVLGSGLIEVVYGLHEWYGDQEVQGRKNDSQLPRG
jgi:hypothetical protein